MNLDVYDYGVICGAVLLAVGGALVIYSAYLSAGCLGGCVAGAFVCVFAGVMAIAISTFNAIRGRY
jgi:hypothetical protein